jgi:flavin reductase
MNIQTTPEPAVSASQFKEAMSRVTGAVHIVTTDGPAGKAGFTATAVCSVTADPPTLLVCVNEGSSVGQAFVANQALVINTIGSEFNDLAMLMGGKTPLEERFAAANWTDSSLGAPMLDGALVCFDGVTVDSQVLGTHRVLYVRVLDVKLGPDAQDPSLYLGRSFRKLAPV